MSAWGSGAWGGGTPGAVNLPTWGGADAFGGALARLTRPASLSGAVAFGDRTTPDAPNRKDSQRRIRKYLSGRSEMPAATMTLAPWRGPALPPHAAAR